MIEIERFYYRTLNITKKFLLVKTHYQYIIKK